MQALPVVTCGDQQRGGAVGADAEQGAELGGSGGGELVEGASERVDLGVQVLAAASQASKSEGGRRGWGGQGSRVQGGGLADQLGRRQVRELLAELIWGGDQQRLDGVDGLGCGP